jgi:outer membrane protein assembly factor BamB
VHGSPTVEFVPPKPKPKPRDHQKPRFRPTPWLTFGFGNRRRHVSPSVGLRPPFRWQWTFRAQRLLEFPPAVSQGKLFLPVLDGRLYALDRRDGRVIWKRNLGRCIAASPTFANGLLVVTALNRYGHCSTRTENLSGTLAVLRARDGKVRWSVALPPTESSPLVAGDTIYIGDWDGWMRAYALTNGHLRWRLRLGGAIKASISSAGDRLYVGAYDGRLYCVSRGGKLLWRGSSQSTFLGRGHFYSTPAVAYGRVYLGSTDGKVYSFGARSGAVRWSYSTGSYVYAAPAVWNGLVLVGSYDSWFYALDAATGERRWRFHANGRISGAATVLDGIVYFSTFAGRTYGLSARDGRLLWSYPDGKYSPIVDDGKRVYLVGYGRLFKLRPIHRSVG